MTNIQAKVKELSFDIFEDLKKLVLDEVGDLSNEDLLKIDKTQDQVLSNIAMGDEFAMECYENFSTLLVLRYKRRVTKTWSKNFLKSTGEALLKILWIIAKTKLGD